MKGLLELAINEGLGLRFSRCLALLSSFRGIIGCQPFGQQEIPCLQFSRKGIDLGVWQFYLKARIGFYAPFVGLFRTARSMFLPLGR